MQKMRQRNDGKVARLYGYRYSEDIRTGKTVGYCELCGAEVTKTRCGYDDECECGAIINWSEKADGPAFEVCYDYEDYEEEERRAESRECWREWMAEHD